LNRSFLTVNFLILDMDDQLNINTPVDGVDVQAPVEGQTEEQAPVMGGEEAPATPAEETPAVEAEETPENPVA